MHPVEDNDLLREYVERGDEEAFATLVSRHVNMVYSVALRTVGNPDHAQEVAQAVFLVFARKARTLSPRIVVGGWLFHAARLTASNFVRNEFRRRRREQEVYMQSQHEKNDTEDAWAQIAPMLDGAIGSLGASDRNALVLRFLEGRELKEVGLAIGTSEEAAKKRVHRALEKLRKFFTKRGVVLSGAGLASALAANSASAAPNALATSITAAGFVKGATAATSTVALMQGTLKVMAWAQLKVAAAVGAGVALATGAVVLAVNYTADDSHDRVKPTTLSPNSPFVRYLSETPWIKKMQFVHGNFAAPGFLETNLNAGMTWVVMTNTFAVQPSGSYFSLNPRMISGVNDQVYWSAQERQKWLEVTPVAPDSRYNPTVENMKPRIEEVQYLGLRGLRPGSFVMHEDGSFTARTLKDELLEGRILKVSNDRPLALTYHYTDSDWPMTIREITVDLTYQYASATAPLPTIIGRSEKSRIRHKQSSGPGGIEQVEETDGSAYPSTNWIVSVEYGLDNSITNGYSPSMFFPDTDQYRLQSNWWANGTNHGATFPPLTPDERKYGIGTNRVNK